MNLSLEKYYDIVKKCDASFIDDFLHVVKAESRKFQQLLRNAKDGKPENEKLRQEYNTYLLRSYCVQQCVKRFPDVPFERIFRAVFHEEFKKEEYGKIHIFEFTARLLENGGWIPWESHAEIFRKCENEIKDALGSTLNQTIEGTCLADVSNVARYLETQGVFWAAPNRKTLIRRYNRERRTLFVNAIRVYIIDARTLFKSN